MAIRIGSYVFDGPYTSATELADCSGLYVILTQSSSGQYQIVDVGESATVRSRVETHDRQSCWTRNMTRGLYCAVLYTPHLQQEGRRQIEQNLRDQYQPVCGLR